MASVEGALAGAGTGAAIGSIVPGLGTGAGALLGGLLGAFLGSDEVEERQKEREQYLDFVKEKQLAGVKAQRLSMLTNTGRRFEKDKTAGSPSALSAVSDQPSSAETGAPKAPSALSGTF